MTVTGYVVIGVVAFVILYFIGAVKIINQGFEAVVERSGRYQGKLTPGLNFIVPLLDQIVWVQTTREQLLDFPPQDATTSDGIGIKIDAIVYWRILEIEQTYYTIEDVEEALKALVITNLRSLIGKMRLEETYSSRDDINRSLLHIVDEANATWGSKVTRIEVQNLILPQRVQKYLESQMMGNSDTVGIPFSNKADWQAVQYAFQKVIVDNEGIELDVQSFETLEDGTLIVRVKVPPEVDRDRLVGEVVRAYETAVKAIESKYSDNLKALDSYREQSTNLINVIGQLGANQSHQINLTLNPATVDVKAIADGSDNSRQLGIGNVGGNLSASDSALNLGDVSGNINNLPHERLDVYLSQLLENIRNDSALSSNDKADAEELVEEMVQAAQSNNPIQIAKAARSLNRMARATPKATQFVQSINELTTLISEVS